MVGGLLRFGIQMASYAASARLVKESARWMSRGLRGAVRAYAKSANSNRVTSLRKTLLKRTKAGTWSADEGVIKRYDDLKTTMSAAVKRRAQAHLSRKQFQYARRLRQVGVDEINFMPANYLMYKVEKHSAVSPEEKEMTRSFTKYYLGLPMAMSVVSGAVMYGAKGTASKTASHIGRKLGPHRVAKMLKMSNRVMTSAAHAGNRIANYAAAAAIVRNRMTEGRAAHSLIGRYSIRDVAEAVPKYWKSALEEAKRPRSSALMRLDKQAEEFRNQMMERKESIVGLLKTKKVKAGRLSEFGKGVDDIVSSTEKELYESYATTVKKKSKVMNFYNKVVRNVKNQTKEQYKDLKEMRHATATRRVAGKDLEIPEGPGIYMVGDKRTDFGRLSLTSIKDTLIRGTQKGIPNFTLRLFGLREIVDFRQSSHALSMAFGATGEGRLYMPMSYYKDPAPYGGIREKAVGTMQMITGEEDKQLVEALLNSRVSGYRDKRRFKGITTDESAHAATILSAAHGEMLLNKDDIIAHLPGGGMKLITKLNIAGKDVMHSFKLGYLPDEGRYLDFLKYTSDTNSMPAKIMRGYLGKRQYHLGDDVVTVGPRPTGQVEDSAGGLGFWGKIKEWLDLGKSQERPIFSKLGTVYGKHRDPRYPTTLYSNMYLKNTEFIDDMVEDINGKAMHDFIDTVGRHSQDAADEFYTTLLRRTKNSDEIVNLFRKMSTMVKGEGYESVDTHLLSPMMSMEEGRGVTNTFLEMFRQKTQGKLTQKSFMQPDIREISRIREIIHVGDTNTIVNLMGRHGSGRRVFSAGKYRELSMMDAYNSSTFRMLMGFNQTGDNIGTMFQPNKLLKEMANEFRTIGLNEKEISAFMTASHLSKLHHSVSKEFSKVGPDLIPTDSSATRGRIKDIITSMTGSTDYTDVVKYYSMRKKFAPYTPWDFDQRIKVEPAEYREIFLIPGEAGKGPLSKRTVPILGQQVQVAEGVMGASGITTMSLFHAFNRAASEFLGIGFDEMTTATPGQYFRKMATKRVLPAIGLYMGYSVADRLADRYLDGTPLGEGLTVFGANILAGARVAAQGMLDFAGVTDVAKYAEDLMPGIITSPLSGLARSVGPVMVGASLGMTSGGPSRALMGGLIGSAVGMLVGGGPLGAFGMWDISKSREEVVEELTGRREVPIRKGRWWELGCCLGSTMIQSTQGFVRIDSLQPGKCISVLSHDGEWHPVKQIVNRPADHIYDMKVSYLPKDFGYTATGNHPILVKSDEIEKPVWKRYDSLTRQDYIAYPLPRRVKKKTYIHATDYLNMERKLLDSGKIYQLQRNWKGGWQKVGIPLPSGELYLSYEIGLIFGHYFGDGNINSSKTRVQGVEIAIAMEDGYAVVERLQAAFEKVFGLHGRVTERGKMWRVRVNNGLLSELFDGLFSREKRVPHWMHNVRSDKFYHGLIEGLIDSDGKVKKDITFKNTNIGIIFLLWNFIVSIYNIIPSIRSEVPERPDGGYYKTVYNLSIGRKADCDRIAALLSPVKMLRYESRGYIGTNTTKSDYKVDNKYVYFKILDISCERGRFKVYDIEVEGARSFTSLGITYHNSSAFSGTRTQYFRPHIYALTRSKYKETPGFKDSIFTDVVGTMAPDIYAFKDYYSRPYPTTAGLFSNIPVFSSMINMVPGSKYLTGAGIALHEEDISPTFFMHQAREMGMPTSAIASDYNIRGGMFQSTDGSAGGFNTDGMTLGSAFDDATFMSQTPMTRGDVAWNVGETIMNTQDIVGLRGFILGSIYGGMTGRRDLFDYAPELASPVDVAGFRRDYWDMELGGIMGASEVIRRYLPHRRRQIQVFNPVRNCLPTWLPGCFVKGTLIETEGGVKQIESVSEGDKLYTHKGRFMPITDSKSRVVNEEVIKLRLFGNNVQRLTSTKEHPYLAVRIPECAYYKNRRKTCQPNGARDNKPCRYCKHRKRDYSIEWVKAGDIRKGDLILYKIPEIPDTLHEIKLSSFVKCISKDGVIWRQGSQNRVRDNIHLDEEFGYICGQYLAEGDASGYAVSFAHHVKERQYSDRIWQWFSTIGLQCKHAKATGGNELVDILHSIIVVDFLSSQFGRKTQKRIPEWVFKSNRRFIVGLVTGYIDGDGSYAVNENSIQFQTIAIDLFYGITKLLSMFGIPLSSTYIKWRNEKENYGAYIHVSKEFVKVFPVIKQTESIYVQGTTASVTHSYRFKDYIAHKVKDISYEHYNGEVYNFEVEDDHSYSLLFATAHNSDYFIDFQHGDPYCLSPVTPVVSSTGCKEARRVRKGDLLLDHNGEYQKVVRVARRHLAEGEKAYKITLSGVDEKTPLEFSESHPLLIRGSGREIKFAEIKDIIVGERVLYPANKEKTITWRTSSGSWEEGSYICSLVIAKKEIELNWVYGFEMEGSHTFCVPGVATHNTAIPMGEARLPGAGYSALHDLDLSFPIEAEMLGLEQDSQIAHYLGFPEFVAYKNRATDVIEPLKMEILEGAKAYGDLLKATTSVYNAQYDVHATADAILKTMLGDKMAIKVVPQGFAGESNLNAFLVMSDIEKGTLLEVDPEGGGLSERMVVKDVQRFQRDISQAKDSAMAAYGQIHELDREGKAMNMANAYSWFDRLRILGDVAPYSSEFKEADAVVKQQMQAGRMDPVHIGEYYQIKDKMDEKTKAFDFQEYRFTNLGEGLTPYKKAKDSFYANEYNFLERRVGSLWEKASHLRSPIHSKLLHHSSALEEYERTSIYGKCMSPDCLVLTRSGTVIASEVRKGDELYTQNGWKKVLNTFSRHTSKHEQAFYLNSKASNITSNVLTGEHPLLVYDNGYEYRKVSDIQKGDWLVYKPLPLLSKKEAYSGTAGVGRYIAELYKRLDYSPHRFVLFNNNIYTTMKRGDCRIPEIVTGSGVPSVINRNKSFYRLIGYYLSEGGLNFDGSTGEPKAVHFTFNIEGEEEYIKEVNALMASVFKVTGYRYNAPEKGFSQIVFFSFLLASFFYSFAGRNSHQKFIDPSIFSTSSPYNMVNLIETYLNGDGTTDENKGCYSVTTVSVTLATQVQQWWMSIGVVNRIHEGVNKAGSRTFTVSTTKRGRAQWDCLRAKDKLKTCAVFLKYKKEYLYNNYRTRYDPAKELVLLKVISLVETSLPPVVHDIEVDDKCHNFTIPGLGIAHNSIKMWEKPVEDYLKSYYYQMTAETEPMQAALSWGTGGMLIGGTPMAAAMAIGGVVNAGMRAVTGETFIPERTEDRREISEQMDAVKYAKFKKLYLETGDRSYLARAGRTITGAAMKGTVLNPKSVGQYLGYPEKNFTESIINNVTLSNIHRVTEVLPKPAVASMYKMIGESNVAAGMMKGDVLDKMINRNLPGFESTIWSPDVPIETPAIQTHETAGLDSHDAGLGWYDQVSSMERAKKMGIWGEEGLYGDIESRANILDLSESVNEKGKLRKLLMAVSSNVNIVDDGWDRVELEVMA